MKKNLRTAFSTRQFMLSKDFEIYYYSDLGLLNVESHAHDYYEFYFFLEGKVEMHIGEKSYELSNGNLVIIPPGTAHYVRIKDPEIPYRRFVFWISKNYCEDLAALSEDYVYLMKKAGQNGYVRQFDTYTFNTVQAKVFQLIEEIHADRFGKIPRISLCVSDLLLHLNRVVYEAEHPKKRNDSGENLYDSLMQYIDAHIEEDLSLETLARKFYVSKYHISHVFSESMGIPPEQYIRKKRLSLCCTAFLNGTEIHEASTAYGFTDYSVFYRAFVKEYGKSPKKYRDELLRNAEWKITGKERENL